MEHTRLENETSALQDASAITPYIMTPSRLLLHRLLDDGVILQEEWQSLTEERQDYVMAATNCDELIAVLAETKLLTDFQAARVLSGGTHHLVFGNYRILDRIGSGGMGIVYRGEHTMMRRPVAIKVLQTVLEDDKVQLQRFFAETRALAKIRHPNIVWAFDAGTTSPTENSAHRFHYLVMEHLEGINLEQLVARGPLSCSKAVELVYQIASALDETHKHNLIHRDIKPSNIFVPPEGGAKLLDFGLALHFRRRRWTDPGTLLGSINYIAPEQVIDAANVDIRADIFGLGGALYYCLTGEPPFQSNGSVTHQIASRLNEAAPEFRVHRPDVPRELETVARRMMAHRREDRYPTPQSVMRALLPFVNPTSHFAIPGVRSDLVSVAPVATERVVPIEAVRRILVVDDEEGVRNVCKAFFSRDGFECRTAEDGEEALRLLAERPFDLVVLDIEMPKMSGAEVLRKLRESPIGVHPKVILMSGGVAADDLSKLLALGANDYLTKPLSRVELLARAKSALANQAMRERSEQLNQQLLSLNAELERDLTERNVDLVETRNAIVFALARIVESRAPRMTDHLTRVARMATALAQTARLSPLFASTIDEPFLNTLNACAILHDIGNLALPDDLLHASDPTEAMDFHTLQTHTTIGAETLAGVARRDKDASAFWRMAIDIARHHHERFDGQGYPDRLAGSDIPLAARIVAIADSYDDLRTPHTLGVAVPHDAAIEHMIRDAGKRFDPNLIESLRACQGEFETLFGN